MNYFVRIILFTIVCLALLSCIEETWPELDKNDQNILVVEGRISNEPGPYTIRLSTTLSLDSIPDQKDAITDIKPFVGAEVKIVDDQNQTELLTEVEDVIYKTLNSNFQGAIERSYKLIITSMDGSIYESDTVRISKPVEVDEIHSKTITIDDVIPGYQFYVSTASNPENVNYFVWELSETYEYHAGYDPKFKYEGAFTNAYYDETGNFHRGTIGPPPFYNIPHIDEPLNKFICWKTNEIQEVYKESTKYLSEARVKNYPLNFIHFTHIKLRQKYSLLVKQLSVDEKYYRYLSEIQEQNSYEENELYTKQPYQLRGNIKNINNPKDVVLGYFFAAGISNKRYFASKDPRPLHDAEYSAGYCGFMSLPTMPYIQERSTNIIVDYMNMIDDNSSYWPVYFGMAYIYSPNTMPWEWREEFVAYPYDCIDCTVRGGSTEEPDFWSK